jgi:hypothetical protein
LSSYNKPIPGLKATAGLGEPGPGQLQRA